MSLYELGFAVKTLNWVFLACQLENEEMLHLEMLYVSP